MFSISMCLKIAKNIVSTKDLAALPCQCIF
jgi:hypothetical protein